MILESILTMFVGSIVSPAIEMLSNYSQMPNLTLKMFMSQREEMC